MRVWKHIIGIARQIELRDAFVFGGLGLAVHGIAELNGPAAWIVCGVVLFALGIKR